MRKIRERNNTLSTLRSMVQEFLNLTTVVVKALDGSSALCSHSLTTLQ